MEKQLSKKSTGFQEKPTTPCLEAGPDSPDSHRRSGTMIVDEEAKNGDISDALESFKNEKNYSPEYKMPPQAAEWEDGMLA